MSTTLNKTFAVLNPNGDTVPVDVTDDVSERLDRDFDSFTGCSLVSCHVFDSDGHTAKTKVDCTLLFTAPGKRP